MRTDLILGTAGHIDHGKTSLIRALTGIDTDRLPEEKKRGITIELGYAHLNLGPYRLGIVDVPGHEKFIRQMLSGATGMDLAMLVVAADDSIKQQTREHLDILRMLDLAAGLVVITKIDLVDPQWLELVRDEIRDLVRGSIFETGEMVATSTRTLAGIEDVLAALLRAAEKVAQRDDQRRRLAPFRLPIDRSFAVPGFGTVVTGSVVSGQIRVGDTVVIHPLGIEARIRGLQNHDQAAEEVKLGQRAAVNLAGIHHEDLSRGLELAAPGFLRPARVLSVDLMLLPTALRALEDRTKVRLHLGTQENSGIIRLLDRTQLAPGERALAQVLLDSDSVATWGQPFVIRQESPMLTLGGGRVLDPHAQTLRRPSAEELQFLGQLAASDPATRCAAAVYLDNTLDWSLNELPATTGIYDPQPLVQQLLQSGQLVEIPVSAQRRVILHRRRFEQLAEQIQTMLKKMHEAAPLKLQHSTGELFSRLSFLGHPEVLQAALAKLAQAGQVILSGLHVALEGHGPKLNRAERQLLPQLVESLRLAGLQVPSLKEIQAAHPRQRETVLQLLKLAVGNGELVTLNEEFFLHRETLESVQDRLREAFATRPGLTVSDIRELLNTSRKYAVPLCEFLDQSGFTIRQGDLRKLRA